MSGTSWCFRCGRTPSRRTDQDRARLQTAPALPSQIATAVQFRSYGADRFAHIRQGRLEPVRLVADLDVVFQVDRLMLGEHLAVDERRSLTWPHGAASGSASASPHPA
jgi:hypothetical protein